MGHAPDGRVVFVRGALPGDLIEVRLVQVKKRFLRGQRTKHLADGPHRQPAFCPHVEACGGCPWQPLVLSEQHAALHTHVQRLLNRSVQGEASVALVVATAPDQGWRSTARLHWYNGTVGYRPASSRSILDIDACPVLTPTAAALYAEVREHLMPAMRGSGTFRLTADEAGGTVALYPDGHPGELGRALARFVARTPLCRGAVLVPKRGDKQRFGDPVNHLGPEGAPHPADGFVQAHQPGNAALVAAAVAAVAELPEGPVLELFAGSGNFTFALARAGRSVVAVERQGTAARALDRAAQARGLGQRVTGLTGDAAHLPEGAFVCALIDPPRAGAQAAVEALHARGLQHLVYVSCDPATLARDVAWLCARGWRLDSATPFDLFPHTGHVETLALLSRVTDAT